MLFSGANLHDMRTGFVCVLHLRDEAKSLRKALAVSSSGLPLALARNLALALQPARTLQGPGWGRVKAAPQNNIRPCEPACLKASWEILLPALQASDREQVRARKSRGHCTGARLNQLHEGALAPTLKSSGKAEHEVPERVCLRRCRGARRARLADSGRNLPNTHTTCGPDRSLLGAKAVKVRDTVDEDLGEPEHITSALHVFPCIP